MKRKKIRRQKGGGEPREKKKRKGKLLSPRKGDLSSWLEAGQPSFLSRWEDLWLRGASLRGHALSM